MKIKKLSYYSVFTCDDEMKNAINIEFPDLPGCVSCAYSLSQARKFAKEALALYLDGMKISDVPQPKKITDDSVHRRNVLNVKVTVMMREKNGILWGFGIKRL